MFTFLAIFLCVAACWNMIVAIACAQAGYKKRSIFAGALVCVNVIAFLLVF